MLILDGLLVYERLQYCNNLQDTYLPNSLFRPRIRGIRWSPTFFAPPNFIDITNLEPENALKGCKKQFLGFMFTLPETNSSPMKIPMLPSKWWIFHGDLLVYRRVVLEFFFLIGRTDRSTRWTWQSLEPAGNGFAILAEKESRIHGT